MTTVTLPAFVPYRGDEAFRPYKPKAGMELSSMFQRLFSFDFCNRRTKKPRQRTFQHSATTCDMSESSIDLFSDDDSTSCASSAGEHYNRSWHHSWQSASYHDSWQQQQQQALYYQQQQQASWQLYHNSFQSPTREQFASPAFPPCVTPSPRRRPHEPINPQDSFVRTSCWAPTEDSCSNRGSSRPRLYSNASTASHRRTDEVHIPTPEQIFRPSIIETRTRSTDTKLSMLSAPSLLSSDSSSSSVGPAWDQLSETEHTTNIGRTHRRNASYCSSSSEPTSHANDWTLDWLLQAAPEPPISSLHEQHTYLPVSPVPPAAALSAVASIFTAGWMAVLSDPTTIPRRRHVQFVQLLSGGVLQLATTNNSTVLMRPQAPRVEMISPPTGHCLVLDAASSARANDPTTVYLLPVHLPPETLDSCCAAAAASAMKVRTEDKDDDDSAEDTKSSSEDDDLLDMYPDLPYAPHPQHDAVMHLRFALDSALALDARIRVRRPART